MKIFDLDGPVYRAGVEIADFLILSIYWLVCCLPIITIGASTSSLFYVFGKKVRGEDAYITKDFFKAFRQNFKQSVPLTLILGILWGSVVAYYIVILGYQGEAPFYILAIAMLFMVEVILFTIYSLAILSRFYMKLSQIILTSFIMAHRHIVTSFLIVIAAIVIEYATLRMPFFFFLSPVILIVFSSMFLQKVFTVHIEAAEELKKAQAQQALQENEEDEEDEEEEDEEDEGNTKVVEVEEVTQKEVTQETKESEDEDSDFLKYI